VSKRIGFVDYKLENYHANIYLKAVREDLAERGFEVAGCFGLDADVGRDWARKNGVPWFDSAEALDRAVDVYAILAPSNPELHADLCARVFPRRKTTYVDKTFAPDLKTAREIFALADRYGLAMQTSSALRYTGIQAHVRAAGPASVRHLAVWGGGRSFAEYAIHPVEIAVSCLGPNVARMMTLGSEPQRRLLLEFEGGRSALVNVFTQATTPYAAAVTTDRETKLIVPDCGRLFIDAAAAMLDLFETGRVHVDRAESLMIRAILDAAECPGSEGRWVAIGEGLAS